MTYRGSRLRLAGGAPTMEDAVALCGADDVVVRSPAGFHVMTRNDFHILSPMTMERYGIELVAAMGEMPE